jgi:hypothetical protein
MKFELHPVLWKAIAAFVQLCLRRDDEGKEGDDDEGGGSSTKIAAGGVTQFAKSPLLQLAALLQATPDHFSFGADASPPPAAAAGASADERKETALIGRCKQLVVAMRHMEPALTDWSQYVELLTTDEEVQPHAPQKPPSACCCARARTSVLACLRAPSSVRAPAPPRSQPLAGSRL